MTNERSILVANTTASTVAYAVGVSLSTSNGQTKVPLDRFLEGIVEGYLLSDLESMKTEIVNKEMGAVTYPMVMTVLAGSELLGQVLSGKQQGALAYYWQKYLFQVDERYAACAEHARELFRNGIAHSYLTKPGAGVVRDQPTRHLTQEEGAGLIFDCNVLYDDFKKSYEGFARAAILADAQAQARLDDLINEMLKATANLPKLSPEKFPVTPSSPTPRATSISSEAGKSTSVSTSGDSPYTPPSGIQYVPPPDNTNG